MTRLKSVQERVENMRASLQNAIEDDRLSIDDIPSLTPEEEAENMYREIQAMAIVNNIPLEEMLRKCWRTVKAFEIDKYCLNREQMEPAIA